MKHILNLLILALAFAVIPGHAQTQPKAAAKAPVATTKAKLAQCEANLDSTIDELNLLYRTWEGTQDELTALTAEKEKLAVANKELKAKLDDAMTILVAFNHLVKDAAYTEDDVKRINKMRAGEILDLGASIESGVSALAKDFVKTAKHDADTVEKYNALLTDYRDYAQRVSNQLAQIGQANRVSNALLLYSLMPKPQPIQIYQPPRSFNCTSMALGNIVSTTCQ